MLSDEALSSWVGRIEDGNYELYILLLNSVKVSLPPNMQPDATVDSTKPYEARDDPAQKPETKPETKPEAREPEVKKPRTKKQKPEKSKVALPSASVVVHTYMRQSSPQMHYPPLLCSEL